MNNNIKVTAQGIAPGIEIRIPTVESYHRLLAKLSLAEAQRDELLELKQSLLIILEQPRNERVAVGIIAEALAEIATFDAIKKAQGQ